MTTQTRRKRFRAMLWSLLFIAVGAVALPAASYLLAPAEAQAQAQSQNAGGAEKNPRANFWRAVRIGESGYSAVAAGESGVFINNGGQNWRQMRNRIISAYGGWGILLALGAVLAYHLLHGRVALREARSGMTVPRWKTWERALHWYTAALFVVLAVTGLSMLFGRLLLIPLLGAKGFSLWAAFSINTHNIIGPFFSLGVLAMLVCWVKNNIPNATDMQWLRAGGGLFGDKHPSAGKANAGEKIWFWIVIFVGLIAVCATGLALIGWLGLESRGAMQSMHQIHAIAALLWIAVFFGHAYIGTLGTEGALEGMTSGRVSVEWAKQHHDLWYAQVKNQAARDEGGGAKAHAAKTASAH